MALNCECCGGSGEHKDGHECYVCDASGKASESRGEVCEGHHGKPDDGPENAKERYGPDFEHFMLSRMRALTFTGGYEGVTHAGLALVSADGVFLAQRTMDETDDPDVQETWEFPGGSLEPDEQPYEAALREFLEETGLTLPIDAKVTNGWRSSDGVYQGFVVQLDDDLHDEDFTPTSECQAVGWFTRETMPENLRPEVRDETPWDLIFPVSGNSASEGDDMTDTAPEVEPDLTMMDLMGAPLKVHGTLAPEDAQSGDGRGFNAGAMTRRDYRLPFMHQNAQASGHQNAVPIGGIDKMMRKDGLILYEASLMPSEDASAFVELLAFFGRWGVSVDGDNGTMDTEKTASTGVVWFDAVRAAGLTACSIPAFAEAYVAFGPHPDMPEDATLTASMEASGDLVTFKRGPGWVTDPAATKRIHDYWTKKGQPGYAKIGWGTPGDFTRAKKLIGEKIAANSPADMKYLNQIIAQWHFDALGYWPGDLGKPGNAPDTPENRKRAARHAASARVIIDASVEGGFLELAEDVFDEADKAGRIQRVGLRDDGAIIYELDGTTDRSAEYEKALREMHEASASLNRQSAADGWEPVLTSSAAAGKRKLPPRSYFDRHPDTGATVIEEPDENGFIRTHGYAGEWGVCHLGFDGRCVEIPSDPTGEYADFHLGRTKTDEGYINTGLSTYMTEHRDGQKILTETAQQGHFDNIANAWCAIRVGEDERGVWFSGVVFPHVPEEDLVLIEAAGQVSGEWKYGAMRTVLAVAVPGFPVMRASATYDDGGEIVDLVASSYGNTTSECEPTAMERVQALASVFAEERMDALREQWKAAH